MKNHIILFVFMIVLCGCEKKIEKVPPLTKLELEKMTELKSQYDIMKNKEEAFEKEQNRVKSLEKNYVEKYIIIENYSLIKSSDFNDGLPRACYFGVLENKGDELVQSLDILFTFYDSNKKILNTWKTSLISANDQYLSHDDKDSTGALIIALSGLQYPLKPRDHIDLSSKKNCMAESFAGWSKDLVAHKLINIKLRPKMSQIDKLGSLKIAQDLFPLINRAKQNNQYRD